MNSTVLRLTEEDFAKLTPEQRLQVRRFIQSGKDGRELARRYITLLTNPEALPKTPPKPHPKTQQKKLREAKRERDFLAEARRDAVMAGVTESPIVLLERVKPLSWFFWGEERFATTEQVADFYDTPIKTVNTDMCVHRSEFEKDGLRCLRGKRLREAKKEIEGLSEKYSHLVFWSPRAILRLCLLMRKSDIALGMRAFLEGEAL